MMIQNHHDWKIHRILDDARKVYICPARGNDKLYTQLELYAELMDQGKEITLMRKKDLPKKDPFKVYKEFLDKDIIYNTGHTWLQDAIDRYIEEEIHKHLRKDIENWRPKVYLDTSLINPRDWYTKQLTIMDSVLGSFIVATEE